MSNELRFAYNVWTPNTAVLLTTVPWSNDYRDIVQFDNKSDRADYLERIESPTIGVKYAQYLRPNTPIRLDVPYTVALEYNYLRVSNPAQPFMADTAKEYFYFILDVRHIAPNTTEFVVQLDVWQTFGIDMKFGRCYVERGHIGIANENQYAEHGRRYLAIPEGLDAGSNMMVVGSQYTDIADPSVSPIDKAMMVVVSTVDLNESGGDKDNPVLVMASGTNMNGLASGASLYFFDDYRDFMTLVGALRNLPWISAGMVAAYVVPRLFSRDDLLDTRFFEKVRVRNVDAYKPSSGAVSTRLPFRNVDNDFDWLGILSRSIPKRYKHLKKFLTSDYSSIQLTTFAGQPLIMKPELMQYDKMRVNIKFHLGQPAPRVCLQPIGYNSGDDQNAKRELGYETTVIKPSGDDLGEGLDFATYLTNFPQVPVLNNNYVAFLAQNTNQIAYNYESAEWSQQRALAGNTLAMNQATANMGLSNTQTGLGVNARNSGNELANQTLGYRSIQGAANSVVGGIASAMGGNVAGGVLSGAMGVANAAADYAIGSNQNNQSTAINNNLAIGMNDASVANMGYVRDTNKQYGDWAAQGDYLNTVRGLNAKVQDAKMTQPSLSGQFGGDAFNYVVNGGFKCRVTVRRIDNASVESIGEFWLRYGYAINRFHVPDELLVMDRFTYWKMHETNLIPNGVCPESYRASVRGIFEKGVTVWRNPDDINTLDIGDNKPLEGVEL